MPAIANFRSQEWGGAGLPSTLRSHKMAQGAVRPFEECLRCVVSAVKFSPAYCKCMLAR